jgi:acyl carrier protein|tara:strand:- start:214 stop:498 length:285 start_codon:yes stop_codon:yes gene_type:complete
MKFTKNNNKKKYDNIEDQIFKIINEVLKKYRKKVSKKDRNLKFYKNGIIDSLDYIKIISEIEKFFSIKMKIETLDVNFSIVTIKKTVKKIISNK